MSGVLKEVYNTYRFFLEKASAVDVKRFCENNGFYLVIYDNGYLTLRKELQGENT